MNFPIEEILQKLEDLDKKISLLQARKPTQNRLLKVGEAASFLGISKVSVYRKVKADEIPYINLGGAIRFNQSDLENLSSKNG